MSMSIVKSFSVGDGDMFYIRHASDNFTVIDCCNYGDGRSVDDDLFSAHLEEIEQQSSDKGIKRFISTHPDNDHIGGLCKYVERIGIINFYCVANEATKDDESYDFDMYCELRDGDNAFHLYKGCARRWMNQSSDERGQAGINCLWPDVTNPYYKAALQAAKNGKSPNNISPIITYACNNKKYMWMGDFEGDFLDKVKDTIDFQSVTVLFAPHHGRDSGKIPADILKKLAPKLIVIGEAPSEYLNYYQGYNTITQNSSGDIVFENMSSSVNIYVSNVNYSVDFLYNAYYDDDYGCTYIGTLI